MHQETSIIPTHLWYVLLSLTLTGMLAGLEANSSVGSRQYLDNQQPISSIWSQTGLADFANSSR